MKKTKELNENDFTMKLVKDLGIVANRRKAIFICNNCKKEFTTDVTVAKNSKTGVCKECNNKVRPKKKILKELPTVINNLKVLNCLGIDSSGKRLAVFECPYCKNSFKARVGNVASKSTTKCHTCGLIHGPRPGFKTDISSIFYVLKFKNSDCIKIGITNNTIEKRYQKSEQRLFEILHLVEFTNGIDAFNFEQHLLRKYGILRYEGERLLKSGNKEILKNNIFTMYYEKDINESISSWGECTGSITIY